MPVGGIAAVAVQRLLDRIFHLCSYGLICFDFNILVYEKFTGSGLVCRIFVDCRQEICLCERIIALIKCIANFCCVCKRLLRLQTFAAFAIHICSSYCVANVLLREIP